MNNISRIGIRTLRLYSWSHTEFVPSYSDILTSIRAIRGLNGILLVKLDKSFMFSQFHIGLQTEKKCEIRLLNRCGV